MGVFIKTHSTATLVDLAHLFISNIFSKHDLASDIISDRGSLFVSSFWTALCENLKIKRNLSTAYHPETDGQTERVNQVLEQYLRMYTSYHQDDWDIWLPLAELAYNNSEHTSTKQTPFFTVYGRHPHFDTIHVSEKIPAGQYLSEIHSTQQQLKSELQSAIQRFKKYADRGRTEAPRFQPGEKVWLSARNIKTTRPTKKLSERWLGPFFISEAVGTHAFRLQLPEQWKGIHPVFHVSLLEPVKESTIPGRHHPPPEPVELDEYLEWEVSQVLDSRIRRGQLQYFVEWKGFEGSDRTTCEPAINLQNAPNLVKDFHKLYPQKPGPNLQH